MQQMDRDRDKNGSSNARPSSLLDKQLEEILRSAERMRRRQLFWRRVRGLAGSVLTLPRRGRRISSGRLMGMGLALCLLAGFLGHAIPVLSGILVLVGALLFLSPIVLHYGRRGYAGGRDQRIWRGRVVEYPDDAHWQAGRAWMARIAQRWRGRPPRQGR